MQNTIYYRIEFYRTFESVWDLKELKFVTGVGRGKMCG